ncbi:MAG TPA: methyltransferase domain-containing protein [Pyrinomonadaceae bacterium]|jgi:hypothetical protein
MAKNLVFISWSGLTGERVAEALASTIFNNHPELKPWVSSKDLKAGRPWFDEINKAAQEAKFGIGCLTPGASIRPWVNFEAGMLFGRLEQFIILRFHEEIAHPLTNLQSKDGTNINDLAEVFNIMTSGGINEAKEWVKFKFPEFKKVLDELKSSFQPDLISINESVKSVMEAVNELKANEIYCGNDCLKQVVAGAVSQLGAQLKRVKTTFSVPASQYPYHLISLQSSKKLNPIVRAVALVDQQERFWQEVAGREILGTGRDKNERVFVFITPEDFTRNYDTLKLHAERYTVKVMSFEALTRMFYPFNKDFSIIESSDSKLLATYDKSEPFVSITFMTDPDAIAMHENYFKKISRFAMEIKHDAKDTMEVVRQRVFERPLTEIKQVHVEMSDYISVEEYDLYEEGHAYYKEMMQRMLDIFSERRGSVNEECAMLELGAGTGIFTKRLAALESVTVEAVEVDFACFKRLVQNIQTNHSNVKFHPEDSRAFWAETPFKFIFSSFADHHIRFEDKKPYLDNVKSNLASGGVFIVGDEFLPSHDRSDKESRKRALELYHKHIIDIAEEQGNSNLMKLEEAALRSGLDEVGDFKITCEEYEKHLQDAGFVFKRENIGPVDRTDVGGVYVYIAWQKS